jgi:hypothetical protein
MRSLVNRQHFDTHSSIIGTYITKVMQNKQESLIDFNSLYTVNLDTQKFIMNLNKFQISQRALTLLFNP